MDLNDRELATVLAALRFWQKHGPKQQNDFFDRITCEEQDLLNAIRTCEGQLETDLSVEEIDQLCERLNAPAGPCKYALYDYDANEMASTTVYDSYEGAATDANQLNNVLVVELPVEVEQDEEEVGPDCLEMEELEGLVQERGFDPRCLHDAQDSVEGTIRAFNEQVARENEQLTDEGCPVGCFRIIDPKDGEGQ